MDKYVYYAETKSELTFDVYANSEKEAFNKGRNLVKITCSDDFDAEIIYEYVEKQE